MKFFGHQLNKTLDRNKNKNLVVLRTPLLLQLVKAPGGEVGEVNKLRAVGVVGDGSLGENKIFVNNERWMNNLNRSEK